MNIGITGRFLSGKSTFAGLITDYLGYSLFSCDEYIRSLYKKDEIKKIIVDSFGNEIYKGSVFQSKVLSERVFQSGEELKKLESIIHPRVEAEINRIKQNQGNTVFEIPLLYETNLQSLMDICILVMCPSNIAIQRAAERGYGKSDFEIRNKYFMQDEIKIRNKPWIVNNDGTLDNLKLEVVKIGRRIQLISLSGDDSHQSR